MNTKVIAVILDAETGGTISDIRRMILRSLIIFFSTPNCSTIPNTQNDPLSYCPHFGLSALMDDDPWVLWPTGSPTVPALV